MRAKGWLPVPAGPKSLCRLKPALENSVGVRGAAEPLSPPCISSTCQQTPLSCATRSCLGDPASVRVCVYTYPFLTTSLSVIVVWVAPVTVHMFAGCRCAEGYLHTRFPVRRCCEWRELSRRFAFLITSKFSSF